MASTSRADTKLIDEIKPATSVVQWRDWPLVDHMHRAWVPLMAIAAVGGIVGYLSGSWLLALAASAGLAGTLWPFFVPVHYEIGSLGLRITALGRTRFIPWHAVNAYQLRSSSIVLYRSPAPTKADVLRSLFVPFPPDEDDALCALRPHLSHAVELSD